MNITIIGSGYVGLVTGACFAQLGHTVFCVDKDAAKIAMLTSGKCPIFEPGLEELLNVNALEGRITYSTSIAEGVKHGTVIFIAVDTPTKETGEADLSRVEDVAKEVAHHITEYRLIVEKSTIPVRTGEWVFKTIGEHCSPGVEFDVASNPEFLREGAGIEDFMHPDRVVIGVSSDKAAGLLIKLYEPLNAPVLLTDIRSAELIKHCANAFLALKISFINFVARICEAAGADVLKVARGIGLDHRIGQQFLRAGIGYGGSCFPKDVSAFIAISEQLGLNFELLKIVEQINNEQKKLVQQKLEKALQQLEHKTIGILGLTFKDNTDDLRNAPSLDIITDLQQAGAKIKVYDPVAMPKARLSLSGVEFCGTPYEAAQNSDALVIVTEWDEFKYMDLHKIKQIMHYPLIIDGRNIYDPKRLTALGFYYHGIGRGEI